MNDQRNQYGYPVMPPREQRDRAFATAYAAEARQRNRLPCNCPTCRRLALDPAVMNIVSAWGKS